MRGGTCPAAVGGAGRGHSVAALGLRSGDSRVFSESSGTRDSPADASRLRGGLCPGLAPPKAARGRQGGSVQLPHLPHGPACHTRTLPSAIGLGQLCPPEIITSLLLLLLLLLQSPSPPLPRGGPRGISPHPAQLCTLGTSELRLHFTEPPAPSSMSSLAATCPSLWTWAGSGRGRWGGGPWTPGLAPGAAGRSSFAPSHHLTSI